MLVASVNALFESIVNEENKNLTGFIENPNELLKPENLAKLDRAIQGVFCFLAFHPRHDSAVFDYVCSPSFSADTGNHILALFTIEELALTPQLMGKQLAESWLSLEDSNYPAYEIVNELFPSNMFDTQAPIDRSPLIGIAVGLASQYEMIGRLAFSTDDWTEDSYVEQVAKHISVIQALLDVIEEVTPIVLADGDPHAKIDRVREAAKIYPWCEYMHYELAVVSDEYGEPSSAIQAISSAIFLNPEMHMFWESLGVVLRRLGHVKHGNVASAIGEYLSTSAK